MTKGSKLDHLTPQHLSELHSACGTCRLLSEDSLAPPCLRSGLFLSSPLVFALWVHPSPTRTCVGLHPGPSLLSSRPGQLSPRTCLHPGPLCPQLPSEQELVGGLSRGSVCLILCVSFPELALERCWKRIQTTGLKATASGPSFSVSYWCLWTGLHLPTGRIPKSMEALSKRLRFSLCLLDTSKVSYF